MLRRLINVQLFADKSPLVKPTEATVPPSPPRNKVRVGLLYMYVCYAKNGVAYMYTQRRALKTVVEL